MKDEEHKYSYTAQQAEEWFVKESGCQEIGERTFQYALRILRLCRFMQAQNDFVASAIGKQLFRFGSSIGASVAEAKSAESTADFVHKLGIGLKEARESYYWLRLLIEDGSVAQSKVESVLDETNQIIAVLTTIIVKAKRRKS